MAKKKANKQINTIVAFVAALLGLAAICMMFLPAVGIKDTDTTYTGMQVAFGYTEVTKVPIIGTEIKATIFNFSFMNMLTYILALVGVVFSILAALGKGSKFANGFRRSRRILLPHRAVLDPQRRFTEVVHFHRQRH